MDDASTRHLLSQNRIEGRSAAELYMTAIDRNLLPRLDHAAYLGRELARAEGALAPGDNDVQDAAPRAENVETCGCAGSHARDDRAAHPCVGQSGRA